VSARDILRPGGRAIGLWLTIPSALTAEVAAASGADYVVVDQQHGGAGPETMTGMLAAIAAGGALPLVRVGSHDPWVIGHALDLGAAGVIVPLVNGADEAAAVVAACRYAPEGVRSWGRLRPGGEEPLCLVMCETRAGLEAVEAIAAVPGLGGIYIGPSDLSLSLGLQPAHRLEHPPVLEAIERVRAACAGAGIVAGLHCLAAEDAARFAAAGFPMITAGGDLGLLRGALAAAVATAAGT
jgi:4-hydroxy-2-oxoheptanedioate aldolase